MSFLDLARKRYAVRSFKPINVENIKLLKILEAGRVAPTAANRQPQRLIVLQDAASLQKVAKAANTYGAPLVIIVCGDKERVWKRPYDGKSVLDIDASIVTDHMMLQATELGLGSVWICYFDPEVLRREFDLPDNLEPVNILSIGYASGIPEAPDRHDIKRYPLNQLVSYEALRG